MRSDSALATEALPPPQPERRRPRAPLLDVALYAGLLIAVVLGAYYSVFSVFHAYDDEGTLLLSLRGFVDGGTLYRDVYAQYGPFYFELFGGFFALTGTAISTDAGRAIVVAEWTSAALLLGLAAHRLTASLPLGLAAVCVAFAGLGVLTNEPMHPVGLAIVLIAAMQLLIVQRSGRWAAIAVGVLLGALVMTKINVGGFAAIALVLAAIFSAGPLRRRRWLVMVAAAGAVALPFLLMAADLRQGWARDYAALVSLSIAAVLAAAWPRRDTPEDPHDGLIVRWIVAVTAAAVVTAALCIVVAVFTGPSPGDIVDGVITEATRVRGAFIAQFTMPPNAIDWAVAALAAAAVTAILRTERWASSPWPGVLRLAAGLLIWFRVASAAPVAIGPSSNQVVLPLVLAWVAAVPPAGVAETPGKRLARLALPLMAVLETLQGYPVAGTQVGASSVLFIPAGALCIADGIAALRRHAAGRGAEWIRRTTVILGALTVALAVKFTYGSVLRPAIDTGVAYSDRTGLPFAGASRVRLQEPDALALTNVVQLLQSNHCTALIGYPSINSLYLWAFIDQPTQTVPGAWMRLLDDRRQQRVVDELERSPRPCAVRNNDMAQFWLSGQAPPDRPLVRYVMTRFTPVAPPQGPYEVLVARPRPG